MSNRVLNAIDPDGRLTIIVPGTYSGDANWAQPGAAFNAAVSRTFGEAAVVLPWSHGNTESARSAGATALREFVQQHTFAPGVKLNIVAHSHGGNVTMEAMSNGGLGRRVDTLVTLGTPIRQDYAVVPNPNVVGTNVNVYSQLDGVQGKGGETLGLEVGSAGRTRPGAQNIEVQSSHSDLHTPEVWTEVEKQMDPRTKPGGKLPGEPR